MIPENPVIISQRDHVGIVTLNRPRRINALTSQMLEEIRAALVGWNDDDSVREIVFTGEGERGFCAGADIVAQHHDIVAGHPEALERFLRDEYALNALIATYPKPITAHLRGISMGGGLGLGQHTSRRVGAATTKWAMPETAIGLWPDVGVCFELSRAPGQVGAFLAMTGSIIDGASAAWAGFLDEAEDVTPDDRATSWLAQSQTWIDECVVGDDPVAIRQRLREHDHADARAAADTLDERCPLSVWLALHAVRRAAQMPHVITVLAQDLTLGRYIAAHPADFVEGVQAKMIDKRPAQWSNGDLSEIDPALVEQIFAYDGTLLD